MAVNACLLCTGPIESEKRELCDTCRTMDQRLDFLILNHREMAIKYIADKFNAANDPQSQIYDRRKTPYQPPPGMHTPDRRRTIRRVASAKAHPKRRKSD